MPRKSADPLVNNLNRVKQRIYRLNKSGERSRAMSLYYSNLKKAGIDIHQPVKLLTEKQREQLFKLNESFLKAQTANVRRNKKINEAIGEQLRKDTRDILKRDPTPQELDNLFEAFTLYHDKDGKLDSMIGTDVIRQANSLVSRRYKQGEKAQKIFKQRTEMVTKYLKQQAEAGELPESEVMAAMLKHGSNYKKYI